MVCDNFSNNQISNKVKNESKRRKKQRKLYEEWDLWDLEQWRLTMAMHGENNKRDNGKRSDQMTRKRYISKKAMSRCREVK